MNDTYIRNVIEAALLAAGRPLQVAEIAQLFDESMRPSNADLRAALEALAAEYESRGIELKETATGFRIQVRRELANEISRLWPERPPRYSRALLETLAIIAYRQPITRAEIEAVRGVSVNPNIIRTLQERNWVKVVGTRDIPGRPELLGTTKEFLDYFGLKSLEELPPLAELKAMGDINLQLDLAGASPTGDAAAAASASSGESAPAEAASESASAHDAAATEEPADASATADAGAAEEPALVDAQTVAAAADDVSEPVDAIGEPELDDLDVEMERDEEEVGDEEDDEELSADAPSKSELVAASRDVDER